ncbi:superoxide dismutase [Pasteuria penetrans]|uniref:superoxide dismutase n=1 Tax=Pasteuria penetrans TaxID=86005 RepID=UPI001FEAE264|nr:superoxide dismutase [Pasteuria penetrans]
MKGVTKYELPPLPYDLRALEPHIDALTMEIHHGRHHAMYVGNLNAALEKVDVEGKSIEELLGSLDTLPEKVRTAVRNNGGGHANHSLFWQILSPEGGGQPGGDLAKDIDKTFGSFDAFKKNFTEAATKRFGSGWTWLVWDGKALQVLSTPNQDSPLMQGLSPIMGLDVWEHSYYLRYQNKRPAYIEAFWNIVYWPEVESRYSRVRSGSLA